MCGVRADDSLSNALSTLSRNGVPDNDSSSVRLKYSAQSSATVSPADRPLKAWPLTRHRVLPSSCDLSSKSGKPDSSRACRSRLMVRVVTAQIDASSSIVTPPPRARSISRRIVHCRMTSEFRGIRRRGYYRGRGAPGRLVERDAPQQVEVGQHLAGAEHDRGQRIFGELDRQPGLVAQPLVE